MNILSSFFLPSRPALIFGMLALGLAAPLSAKQKVDKSPMIRLVCPTALPGHDEYVVASRDKKGSWHELQTLQLRSAFISPWLAVRSGELFLCVREEKQLVSKCSFTYPDGVRRALLILQAEPDKDEYKAQVVDTAKQAFGKGEILLINSSTMAAEVMLGTKQVESQAGESTVQKPSLEENGMYHLLVTYKDETDKVVTCHDSYVPGNDSGRDFLFLLSDPDLGLRVMSLPDFGPFE